MGGMFMPDGIHRRNMWNIIMVERLEAKCFHFCCNQFEGRTMMST
jgi:hypothetical protein